MNARMEEGGWGDGIVFVRQTLLCTTTPHLIRRGGGMRNILWESFLLGSLASNYLVAIDSPGVEWVIKPAVAFSWSSASWNGPRLDGNRWSDIQEKSEREELICVLDSIYLFLLILEWSVCMIH